MWQLAELVAFGIFASYFLLILGLFGILGQNVTILGGGRTLRQHLFSVLTIASFAHTWYYMLAYLLWSFSHYVQASGSHGEPVLRQVSGWLRNTGLFEQAWATVSTNAMPWWLSEPICLFTVGAWTVFLATNGRKFRINHLWAYMALGQLVAISVATNLFFLTILLKDNQKRTRRSTTIAPPTLWVSVLVALLAVGISPYTDATTFLPNLLVMHFFVFLPLLPVGYNTRSMFAIRTKTLYLLAATVAVGLRLRTTYAAAISLPAREQSVLGFLSAALATLHAHPAQSSIGWDVIWTTISLLLWLAFAPPTATPSSARRTKPPRSTLLMSAITSLLFSVGIGAPLAFHQDVDDSTLTKAQVS